MAPQNSFRVRTLTLWTLIFTLETLLPEYHHVHLPFDSLSQTLRFTSSFMIANKWTLMLLLECWEGKGGAIEILLYPKEAFFEGAKARSHLILYIVTRNERYKLIKCLSFTRLFQLARISCDDDKAHKKIPFSIMHTHTYLHRWYDDTSFKRKVVTCHYYLLFFSVYYASLYTNDFQNDFYTNS